MPYAQHIKEIIFICWAVIENQANLYFNKNWGKDLI